MTAARLVFPAMRWQDDGGFGPGLVTARAAIEAGVGGFILFGGTRETVSDLTGTLREFAGRPLLFAADLERGAGQQVRGLTELPPPGALASFEDEDAIRVAERAGALTGAEARSVGVDWVLGPVADLDCEPRNPIIGNRSFGHDPNRVAALVAAWIGGCQRHALACAKHYPGHGRTVTDSHTTVPVVEDSAEDLSQDVVPFAAALSADVASVMTAHVAFPALDPSGTPATFSRTIVGRLRASGFDGVIVSDALVMEGARGVATPNRVARRALDAGIDLLLYPDDPVGVANALREESTRDPVLAAYLAPSLARLDGMIKRVELLAPPERLDDGLGAELANQLLARGCVRETVVGLMPPVELVVVDDDLDGDYPPSSSDGVRAALIAAGIPLGVGGSRVVLAFAEPRAGKRRGGFGPRALEALSRVAPDADLVVLFAQPRLSEAIPGGAPVLVAWHRQRLMQEAVAEWIMGRAR